MCKNKRIKRNKVFKGVATVGKSTMGYFYGFNLHLIVNDKGEVLNFVITQGNVDDREPLKNERFIESIKGKLYGDKGYLSRIDQYTLCGWASPCYKYQKQYEKLPYGT